MAQGKFEITDNFRRACEQCLNPGDVAHEHCFSLQHAMSAIEIMNPSMDISMVKFRKVYYLHEAIDSGYLSLDAFSDLSLLLGLIDELVSSFVNWITGDSLVQTVYTCMYMHCIPLIGDKFLSAFCEGFRRCLYICRELLLSSPVFEEEDFCGLTHGVPLNKNTAEIFPNRSCANTLFSYSNKDIESLLLELEVEIISLSDSAHIRKFILVRLRFLRYLLKMLTAILPVIKEGENDSDITDIPGYSTNGCEGNPKFYQKSEFSLNEILDISVSVANVSQELIGLSSEMLSSATAGTSAGAGKLTPKTQTYGLPGFEPFLMQANLPSTVQKTSIILDRSISFNFLKCLFTRINYSMSKLCCVIVGDDLSFVSVHDIWSLLHNVGHNLCHSVCYGSNDKKCLSDTENQPNDRSCFLSRSILNIFTVAFLRCRPRVPEASHCLLGTTPPATNMLLSWISIESPFVQKAILKDLSVIGRFNSFLDLVGSQFLLISRNFCFNRSRQRSNMERIFCHLHELLEDSCSVENAIAFSISELQQQPNLLQRPPVALHLAAYICYFYYHLAWDYIGTGFQLDLYSCHEWVYMYSFGINVIRSLSNLLQHIANPLMEREINSRSPCANDSNQDANSPLKPSGKRRRRRGQPSNTKGVQQSSAEEASSLELELPSVSMDYWKYQMAITNVHRFLLAATIYTLRALQRDLGIDLSHLNQNPHCSSSFEPLRSGQRKFYGSVCTQFLHRLGVLISSPTSPLAEAGGALAAFKSTHEYLISTHFMECPTTDLYLLASKMYAVARQWIKNANDLLQALSNASSSAGNSLYSHMTPLGPVDPLNKLDHLAKNNDVVSRLLAACSDKRPKLKPSENPYHPDILSTQSSVKFDFNYLSSKHYPLLKLITPT